MNIDDNQPAILTHGLTKSFAGNVAVNGLDLSVQKGEMFGLVGPNGAGKSTVIRLLCGILRATSGSGSVAGHDLDKERDSIHGKIGYLSQNFTLYGDLTVDENIEFFATIHGVRSFKPRRDQLLEFTRLTPFRNRLAQDLSGGMKKKLALACTLVHTPDIILLDEPSTGVDPVSRGEFWSILSSILDRGVTVFMTTPYLDEAERCRRISLIHRGKIVMTGSPAEIKQAMPGAVYDLYCADAPAVYSRLRENLPATSLTLYGDHLRLWATGESAAQATAARLKNEFGGNINLVPADPSLEDAFVALLRKESIPGEVLT